MVMDSPAWVRCECGEWWRLIHQMHASECPCLPVDELDFDPYIEGFVDEEKIDGNQNG